MSMMEQGGYRKPSNPAPVSGPGALSQRTDGGPTQPATYISGLPQGEGQATYDQQLAAPMMGAVKMSDLQMDVGTTDLDAPSDFLNEDIHHGASWGNSPTLNLNGVSGMGGINPVNVIYRAMSMDPTGRLEAIYNRINIY
jgi:hypothetical protein